MLIEKQYFINTVLSPQLGIAIEPLPPQSFVASRASGCFFRKCAPGGGVAQKTAHGAALDWGAERGSHRALHLDHQRLGTDLHRRILRWGVALETSHWPAQTLGSGRGCLVGACGVAVGGGGLVMVCADRGCPTPLGRPVLCISARPRVRISKYPEINISDTCPSTHPRHPRVRITRHLPVYRLYFWKCALGGGLHRKWHKGLQKCRASGSTAPRKRGQRPLSNIRASGSGEGASPAPPPCPPAPEDPPPTSDSAARNGSVGVGISNYPEIEMQVWCQT
jgi:hypothetical protein